MVIVEVKYIIRPSERGKNEKQEKFITTRMLLEILFEARVELDIPKKNM